MKKIPVTIAILIPALFLLSGDFSAPVLAPAPPAPPVQTLQTTPRAELRVLEDRIQKGDTLSGIFRKHGLDVAELPRMREACTGVLRLRELRDGRPYRIVLDGNGRIDSFSYGITDEATLKLTRAGEGFAAEKVQAAYERRLLSIGRTIRNSLIAAMEEGGGAGGLLVALQLSDILAGDIDFSTDLRVNDTFKIIVEGLYRDGKFVKYGEILAAEFHNNGKVHRAYAFGQDGKTGYYDQTGRSLRRSFLKSPLSFRRISSGFSRGRYHPILKILRPHQGIDYAAAAGTPVSAAGDGRVLFAGSRGQYGNLVILSHRNGYKTYYGHLSRIAGGVRTGAKMDQGSVIGFVGATGLATGPHLHYEMRINDRPVSPVSVKAIPGDPLPQARRLLFTEFMNRMDAELGRISPQREITLDDGSRREKGKEG
jgi:murein DD-endopeptidase MepM/ murein hydrolase activator NlpD